jgi:transaldolase
LRGLEKGLSPAERTEEIIRIVTVAIAEKFLPVYRRTDGAQGFVCAQVDPNFQGDADKMIEMAKRLHGWAENIAVKLPATAAGLEAMEACAALGMTTVGTVSFTVPQAVEIARRQTIGVHLAVDAGRKPGQHFSVVMVGRQDDYLRDVIHDAKTEIPEAFIRQAGTAVIKRAYEIVRREGYVSSLMPAGMRGAYHVTELAGAAMSMSVSPNIQAALAQEPEPYRERIDEPVGKDVIECLLTVPEFRRAYEPDGMLPADFLSYGLAQRTLSQFVDAGWGGITDYTSM